MAKTTKKNLSKKLIKYGAFSLAAAGVADASGQVNFTDLDPDFEGLSSENVEFFIDFNDDGIDDLRIIGGTFSGNNFTAINNDAGAVSGLTVGQLVGAYTYALNLDDGVIIDSGTGDFGNVGSLCYLGGIADTFCGEGNSTPNGFAGVSFDIAGESHFGWVRLENVTADGFTVTGFAYDETPDTAIAAGNEGLSVDDSVFEGFSYFVDANSVLNLSARTAMQNINLYNITGQEVISQRLNGVNGTVNLGDLSTGIYIATVTIDGQDNSIKIVKR